MINIGSIYRCELLDRSLQFGVVDAVVIAGFFVGVALSFVEVIEDGVFVAFVEVDVVLIKPFVFLTETVVALELIVSSGHFSPTETTSDEQKQAKCDPLLVGPKTDDFSEHAVVCKPQIPCRLHMRQG